MCAVLSAPRNADVPAHLYEGRGNVTVEYVPNDVGEQLTSSLMTTISLYLITQQMIIIIIIIPIR